MQKFFIFSIFLISTLSASLNMPGLENNAKPIKRIYRSLNPKSAIEHFAFYSLYPNSPEGKKALKKAWRLLGQKNVKNPLVLPTLDINLMIDLVNKKSAVIPDNLNKEKLSFLESLGKNLKNRKLKGHNIWKLSEVRKLSVNDIDLARALFLEDLNESEDAIYKIRYYEVTLDLMALQILSKLNDNPTDLEMVEAINEFIFYDMRFRFPPHSVHAKEIDTFTFLSTVMDSRRGVCLGVSTLYLTLAQRLGLNLEIVTPPGHIYVRYNDKGNITNIETTARGVDYPSEVYLGMETKKLQMRNLKEVVGLAFINQASVFWGRKKYKTAVELYEKAQIYVPDSENLKEMMGLNLLFLGEIKKAEKLLKPLKHYKSPYLTSKETLIEDYLDKKADVDALKTIFLSVDEKRESIIKKQNELKKIVKKYPKFRSGLMQLANAYLQLGREKEALIYLNKYYKIDPSDPVVNYYLSAISFQRYDYINAWKYLKTCEKLLIKENHYPKALKEFKESLKRTSPDPAI